MNPRRRAAGRRRGAAWLTALALGLAAVGLIGAVIALVQSSGGGEAGSFDAVKGRWIRPDGGYVLEIRGAGADGRLDAAYFNPAPIRVSRAAASRDGETTKVFVELDDPGKPNYRGCTYTLTYDPKHDVLAGVYYQAVMRASYDIYFERER